MRHHSIQRLCAVSSFLVLTALTAAAAFLGLTPSARPIATAPLSASLAEDAMQFFKNKGFDGNMFQVSDVTGNPSWKNHEFKDKKENDVTSLRWNLPRGVVVSLHEQDNGLGRTVFVFGSGEIAHIKPWKLNDRISSWAWNYIGGVTAPTKRIADGIASKPKYAKDCDLVATNSIQLFKNSEVKGTMTQVEKITTQDAGVFKPLPITGTSSMKWNLPDGVLVVFSEGGNGEGQQLAIWGRGMFDSFKHWDMSDKVKQWAWYYVGEETPTSAGVTQ